MLPKTGKTGVPCAFCGKIIYRWPYQIRQSIHLFCNHKCQINYLKKHPRERVKNKGMFEKGSRSSPKTEFQKGGIPWNKGIKRPEMSGDKNPMYGIKRRHTDKEKEKIRAASLKMWETIPKKARSVMGVKRWDKMSDASLFNYFKNRVFRLHKLSETDIKAIKAKVLIFKIRRQNNGDKQKT